MMNETTSRDSAKSFFPFDNSTEFPTVRLPYFHEGSFVLVSLEASDFDGSNSAKMIRCSSLLELSRGRKMQTFQSFIPRNESWTKTRAISSTANCPLVIQHLSSSPFRRTGFIPTCLSMIQSVSRHLKDTLAHTTLKRESLSFHNTHCTSLSISSQHGSGTTGVVALKLGCSFLGLELQPNYVAMSRKRLGEVMPLFALAS